MWIVIRNYDINWGVGQAIFLIHRARCCDCDPFQVRRVSPVRRQRRTDDRSAWRHGSTDACPLPAPGPAAIRRTGPMAQWPCQFGGGMDRRQWQQRPSDRPGERHDGGRGDRPLAAAGDAEAMPWRAAVWRWPGRRFGRSGEYRWARAFAIYCCFTTEKSRRATVGHRSRSGC